jgi:hypothetical protein
LAHPTNDQREAEPAVDDLIRLARIEFGILVALVFRVLHGGKNMVPASYINLIVEALMRTTTGGKRRLIFNLPPGYMKSTLITVLYTAWRLGVNPLEKIICISYGDDLSHDLHTRAIGELLSPRWQSAETVQHLRKTVPPHIFEAQYQQNPVYGGSGMCSVERLVRYSKRPPFLYTIHSWDVAATKNGGNFTVCLKFGVAKDDNGSEIFYLFEVLRIRVELPVR